jgi:hypothetical protein
VSRVSSLTLATGAVAIVPLTFLPRYPHDEHDMPKPSNSLEGGDSSPPLNSYQRADLAHLVGEEALEGRPYYSETRRNNLDYNRKGNEFEVKTSIVVETSRGTTILPITASSVRSNNYRVPERIRFHPRPPTSKTKSTSAMLLQAVDRNTPDMRASELPSFDCYDLFLFNPKNEPLYILEAMVSKPDSVSLFDVSRDPRLQNTSRLISDWGNGEKVVSPGVTEYVTTVCPTHAENPLDNLIKPAASGEPSSIDYSKLDINLGYLQLKTEQDTLFVLLEWYLTVEHLKEEASKQRQKESKKPTKRKSDTSKLRSHPSVIKTHLVPSVTQAGRIMISIRNLSNEPIKIMRASLLVDREKAHAMQEADMRFILNTNLRPTCDSAIEVDPEDGSSYRQCTESGIIDGDTLWEDGMYLEAGIANDTMATKYLRLDEGPSEVTGRIVVTATTDINATYDEWLDNMKRNPYNQDKVVLEIPWSIKMVDGLMHAVMEDSTAPNSHLRHDVISSAGGEAVDALFFPFEPLDLRDWTHWPGVMGRMYDYELKAMSHTVRIVAFSHMPLNITKLRVVRDENDPHSKICDRFQVTQLAPESKELGGIYDIGAITVNYDFEMYQDEFRRREGKGAIQDSIHPSICSLTFETAPVYTGLHVMKLVVFTGKVEVTTDDPGVHVRSTGQKESVFNKRGTKQALTASLAMGLEEVIAWFGSSVIGASLLQHLRRYSRFGRWTSTSSLFREYLLTLANVTEDGVDEREGFVEPILMQAGAIAHGETLTMPLHFTNHNPVPIQVFIDVSEVEGMSISISREASRLRGDGNSIPDYLPHKTGLGFDRIHAGGWASHSREGLKSFLVNSDYASSFFEFLPYRDAIEVSPRATSRLPILRSLFKKRAKATFHADKHSLNFYSEKMPGCSGDEKIPSNYVKIDDRADSYPGPLLLSEDLSVTHENTVCDPDFMPDISMYPRSTNMMYLKQIPVTIPPGGVARFELKVRAPDRSSLTKDVTPFISTGLVISTDHGQIMPIVVTFEALLGQLKLFRNPDWVQSKRLWQEDEDFSHQYNGELVDVPLKLFDQSTGPDVVQQNKSGITISPSHKLPSSSNLTTWMQPIGASSIPLYLSSSFSRDVILRDIKSCNPWFHVKLKEVADQNVRTVQSDDTERSSNTAVEIGTLHTAVRCPTMHDLLGMYHEIAIPQNAPIYPSFYQCALEWLENRTLLQSYGCGTKPMPQTLEHADYGAEDDATERALDALNHAITFSMLKYGNGRLKNIDEQTGGDDASEEWGGVQDDSNFTTSKSGGARGSALVDRLTLDIYAEITDAWRVISELDLHSISSNFKATVEYAYSKEKDQKPAAKDPQSLTVSMRDVAIRTKLSMPSLVKPKERYIYDRSRDQNHEDEFFSVFEFPMIPVAELSGMTIPLHNPTGVPVKVRLATVSWDEILRDADKAKRYPTLATDDVRETYLERFESVFTQTGFDATVKSPGDSWWEGHGAYYQADEQGQLVQSRHNITIRAGGKAHVSLINPALYAQSAFTVGCGARCGLREESSMGNRVEMGLRRTSPIGASAAVGAALVGIPRSAADLEGVIVGGDEATISAGGTANIDDAPSAFAVPYSSFDEIVIPPYGEAEIGPIMFRPPGRFALMGCDSILDNDSIPWGERIGEVCSSTIFESMLFLENSLTGLERVVLRGKALWESVVFLDPIGGDSPDAYGDLELRNGHTTLVFPGSCVSNEHAGLSAHPVSKGVILQNDGDVDVEFSRVFFVDSTMTGAKKRKKHVTNHGCEHRGFRLLECSQSEGPTFGEEDNYEANIFHGFTIAAGGNKTVFLEHHPDCTFRSDFIVLNFEFERDRAKAEDDNQRESRDRRTSRAFKRQNLELLVGFDMSQSELKACIPVKSVNTDPVYMSGSRDISRWNNKTSITVKELTRLNRAIILGGALREHLHTPVDSRRMIYAMIGVVATVSAVAILALLVFTLILLRSKLAKTFCALVKGPRGRADSTDRRISHEGGVTQSSWSSTFRCLARADPSSSDLQTIGREQVRQIVLHRYKTMGVLLPHCIDSTGSFNREDGGQSTRSGVAGKAKLKTLSEALFQRCNSDATSEPQPLSLPCGLDWKTASARGMLQSSVGTPLVFRSARILASRNLGSSGIPLPTGTRQTKDLEFEAEADAKALKERGNGSVLQSSSSGGVAKSESLLISKLEAEGSPMVEKSTTKVGAHLAEVLKVTQVLKTVPSSEDQRWEVKSVGKREKPQRQEIKVESRRTSNEPSVKSKDKLDDASSAESSSIAGGKQQKKKVDVDSIPEGRKKQKKSTKRAGKAKAGQKSRNKSKLPTEPSSPASFKSVSTRSTTDIAASPLLSPHTIKETTVLRPPPGLAPPPGFGELDSSMTGGLDLSVSSLYAPPLTQLPQSLSAFLPPLGPASQPTNTDSSTALDLLYGAPPPPAENASSSSLFHTIRATDEKALEISQRALMQESMSSIDGFGHKSFNENVLASVPDASPGNGKQLLGAGGGFDVMGFLDNILDESEREVATPIDAAIASAPPLTADPWAPGRKSRAAAYGIFVQDSNTELGGGGVQDSDGHGIVQAILAASPHSPLSDAPQTVRLLTPAALASGKSVFDDDDDDEDDDDEDSRSDYNSGDFYAKLLGE